MSNKLHYNVINDLLLQVLKDLMANPIFDSFRLVGGTALSLFIGHRESVDIDLFSDADYGSIDFKAIDIFLKNNYSFYQSNDFQAIGMGKSYLIGDNKDQCIKLDLYYTDPFFDDIVLIDNIRIASVEEIIAMKIDVIQRTGRKKDFWDLHELMENYSFEKMLFLHEKRYPYNHKPDLIKHNFTQFSEADDDFDPICLKGKFWEIIKLDMIDFIS
ncbi:MAG: nucleotidyl transferase AbiEii/AbiGii toxin family protein [Bacteroidota bacterium]